MFLPAHYCVPSCRVSNSNFSRRFEFVIIIKSPHIPYSVYKYRKPRRLNFCYYYFSFKHFNDRTSIPTYNNMRFKVFVELIFGRSNSSTAVGFILQSHKLLFNVPEMSRKIGLKPLYYTHFSPSRRP